MSKPQQAPQSGAQGQTTGSGSAPSGVNATTSAPSTSELTESDRSKSDRPPAPAADERREYYVVGPGSIQFQGKIRRALDRLMLTDEQAEALGDAVKAGKPPAAPASIASRKAGTYKVKGPGSVFYRGRIHPEGTTLELSERDARSLGNAVEDA